MTHSNQTGSSNQTNHMHPGVPGLTPLEEPNFSVERQGHSMRQFFQAPGGQRLRAEIRCDSVPQQSFAVLSVLDPVSLKWSVLASIPHSQTEILRQHGEASCYGPLRETGRQAFLTDRDALLRQATLLLC